MKFIRFGWTDRGYCINPAKIIIVQRLSPKVWDSFTSLLTFFQNFQIMPWPRIEPTVTRSKTWTFTLLKKYLIWSQAGKKISEFLTCLVGSKIIFLNLSERCAGSLGPTKILTPALSGGLCEDHKPQNRFCRKLCRWIVCIFFLYYPQFHFNIFYFWKIIFLF